MHLKTIKLNQITEINTGFHFRARIQNDPDGNVAVLQMSDIQEAEINFKTLKTTKIPKLEKLQDRLLKANDILIQNRGNAFKATQVKKPLKQTIASAHFFCLRLKDKAKEKISAKYLTWCINQTDSQKQINKYTASSNTVKMLNKDALNNLTIKLPPLKVQQKIIDINSLMLEEEKILRELTKLVNIRGRAITKDIFNKSL